MGLRLSVSSTMLEGNLMRQLNRVECVSCQSLIVMIMVVVGITFGFLSIFVKNVYKRGGNKYLSIDVIVSYQ